MNILVLAWRGITRRPGRLVLTILPGIALFGLVTLLANVEYALRGLSDDEIDSRSLRIATAFGAGTYFSLADAEHVKRIPHVIDVAVEDFSGAHTIENEGTTPFDGDQINSVLIPLWASINMYVPPEEIKRFDESKNAVIIGGVIAKQKDWKVGDHVFLDVGDVRAEFVVTYIAHRGVLQDHFYIHAGFFEDLTHKPTPIGIMFAVVDDVRNLPAVRAQVTELFSDRQLESLGLTLADSKGYNHRRSALMISIFRGVGLLAVLLVFGMTLTTVILSVEERQVELATLRAIGYRRVSLLGLILLEAVVMVFPGAFFGALATSLYFRGRVISLGQWDHFSVGWVPMFVTMGVGVMLGLIGALMPALKVMRMHVLLALREE